MNTKTKDNLIARGLPTDLIEKIGRNDHTVNTLKVLSLKVLRKSYTEDEISLIKQRIQRSPIAQEVINNILSLSNGVCCYCMDGNSSRPYQIHHIVEHAATQDDSLDNLMLVCPTHHSAIPMCGYSVDQQKAQRESWYALVEVERSYEKKGIPFPYESFEALVAVTKPDITELIQFKQLSPSTAQSVSKHSLAAISEDKLRKENFLMITGGSGVGKSTLAVGVAVSTIEPKGRVYRYVRSYSQDSRQGLQEILKFINTVVKPSVLILDDVNLWLTREDIQKISKSASSIVRIIATSTRASSDKEEEGFDISFISNRIFIDWEIIKPFVTDYLRNHEPDVVEALKPYRNNSIFDRISLEPTEPKLLFLMRRYQEEAKSVWQFLYLLRAGWKTVENELIELISDGRADIPVLYSAIEQIAGVERAVSVNEATLISKDINLRHLPDPDTNWVESIFNRLVQRRLMVKVRNRYTTVHREWARAFIAAALNNLESKESTAELLKLDFDTNTAQPQRLAHLLSWLEREKSCREFIHGWMNNQSYNDWLLLIDTATKQGLAVISSLAESLNFLSRDEPCKELITRAFKDSEENISELVRNASSEDWEYLRRLFYPIDDETTSRIVKSWEPRVAATVFNQTNPEYYHSIGWLLGGNICKHSQDWCYEVGKYVDWSAIRSNLSNVNKGDVETIENCLDILTRLDVPIMRSMVSHLADIISSTLKDAALNDIRFESIGMMPIFEVFPEEIKKIVSSLNPEKIAAEISSVPPHNWTELMGLSWISARAGSTFPQDLVEYLDTDKLQETVRRYAEAFPRIFLPLLWQLEYGRPERRFEIATKLYDSAVVACQNENERDRILQAYTKIDKSLAMNLAKEVGVNLPEPEKKTEEDIDLNKPLLETIDKNGKTKEQLKIHEESGEDYDVGAIIYGHQS